MKRILLISTICITQLYGMESSRLLVAPEKAAHAIATSVLHPASKNTPDEAIQNIKGYLQDDSLSSAASILVKDALINILSAQVFERHQFLAPEEKNTTIIRTMFFDGTASIEQERNFYPLDRSEPTTLHPKPRSPWYDLTFEYFIRSYCAARSSYAEQHK